MPTHPLLVFSPCSRHVPSPKGHLQRAGIDGLTPADRFFGRWEEVRQEVEARARHRPLGSDPHITEERLPEDQVEVVRLMFVGDRLELRLLGHTSVLGTTRS